MTYTTLKLKHDPRGDVDAFTARRKQYSSLFRILYNKLVDNPSLKYDDAVKIVSTYNNLELNDSYLRNAAFQDAKAEYDLDTKKDNKGHKVIFGGKDNFIARRKKLITKEEYKDSRLRPLYVIGEANKGGNGRFNIQKINSYHNELKRLVNHHFKGVATKYLNNYVVYNNFVNWAKGSFYTLLGVLKDFVYTTECNTKGYKIIERPAVPI